jgi:hypothetical protein
MSVFFVKWRVLIGEIIFLVVCFSYALFLISSIYDGTTCELGKLLSIQKLLVLGFSLVFFFAV